jgi:hypothetical protein
MLTLEESRQAGRAAHDEYRSEDRSLVLRWLGEPLFMPMVRAPTARSPLDWSPHA